MSIFKSFWTLLALGENKNLIFHAHQPSLIMDYEAEKLQRIIENLISNALKYTPEYGKIRVVTGKVENHLNIDISDTGVGISKNDLPFIFDRFYQSDTSITRQNEGTGIGLSLVKELIVLLKGEITVTSVEGKGTKFSIVLPITNEANNESIKSKPNINHNRELVHITETRKDGSRKSQRFPLRNDVPIILLIEDNTDVLNYLKSILSVSFVCHTAKNGTEGIRTAHELIPDIIISDVMMPEMSGYEVCESLKSNVRTSHIPIILLTAKAAQEDRIQGLSKGADAYLSKPFNKEELFVRIEQLIDLRAMLQEAFKSGAITQKVEDEFLTRLNKIIFEHLDDEDFDVSMLVQAITMSRTQLHRKIKAVTNMSTTQYVRHIKLNEGKKLLESTNLNVSEVAFRLGFKYPTNFTAAYKNHFGTLPAETKSQR